MSSYKLGMMGDPLSSEIFSALGIDTFEIENEESADIKDMRKTLLQWIKSGEYGAIFITERFAEKLDEILDRFSYSYLPSIILIPEIKGSKGLAESIVRETLKRAAGRDIMAEEE